MSLTEKQWEEMYKCSIRNGADIRWIREILDSTSVALKICNDRVIAVEKDQAFMRGKIARFAGSIAAVCSIVVTGILWLLNHIGGK